MDALEDERWATYRATGDVAARNWIVEHHLPIVHQVVSRLGPFLARHADHDDLVSYGTLGLIDAVAKFDPATSTNFRGFAWKRIKGEILDQLRRHDHVRRNLRMRAREVRNAHDELVARLQREPTGDEIAGELGVSRAELEDYLAAQAAELPPHSLSLVADHVAYEGDVLLADTIAAVDDVESSHQVEHLRDVVAGAWNDLPARERTMLALRYVEGLTLAQAGEVLGIAASRVSQLHSDALRALKAGIARR